MDVIINDLLKELEEKKEEENQKIEIQWKKRGKRKKKKKITPPLSLNMVLLNPRD